MSEEQQVEQLGNLLNDALGDFGKTKPVEVQKPKFTSDDDLDDFLAPMDAAATRQAADAFEKMLKEFAEPTAAQLSAEAQLPSSSTSTAPDGTHFLSELLGINKLLDEEGADPEIRQLTETLLKGCFTKDVIHPLVQQFHKAIEDYLNDPSNEFNEEERKNLEGQKEVFNQLITAYEIQSDPATQEQIDRQNELWANLRELGEVPPALIEKFEAQMPQMGVPGLSGMPTDQQCSIM